MGAINLARTVLGIAEDGVVPAFACFAAEFNQHMLDLCVFLE